MHTGVAGDAGGYTSAFVGAGWWQPFGKRWNLAGELLGGAAGGGGVDSGGAVAQATVYAGLQLSPAVGVRLARRPHQVAATERSAAPRSARC